VRWQSGGTVPEDPFSAIPPQQERTPAALNPYRVRKELELEGADGRHVLALASFKKKI
jgi:hypothetical protein